MFYAVVEHAPSVKMCALFTSPVDAVEYTKKASRVSATRRFKIFQGDANKEPWTEVNANEGAQDDVTVVRDGDHWTAILTTHRVVVVDYTATWCGPCQKIAPFFHHLAQRPDFAHIKFVSVDVDRCRDVAMDNNVSQMPTFQIWFEGQRKDDLTLVGANSERLQGIVQAAAALAN